MIKRAFTLVEVMISVVILGILIVSVFKIYSMISDISIRIENEKTLDNNILYLSQFFQNISDKYDIDYSRYSNLDSNHGLTTGLYLTGNGTSVSIYSTGDCNVSTQDFRSSTCWLQMKKGTNTVNLTDKNKIYFKNIYFKIMPFENPDNYNLNFENIYHKSFGVFGKAYIKYYNKSSRPFDVSTNYENFFNINKY